MAVHAVPEVRRREPARRDALRELLRLAVRRDARGDPRRADREDPLPEAPPVRGGSRPPQRHRPQRAVDLQAPRAHRLPGRPLLHRGRTAACTASTSTPPRSSARSSRRAPRSSSATSRSSSRRSAATGATGAMAKLPWVEQQQLLLQLVQTLNSTLVLSQVLEQVTDADHAHHAAPSAASCCSRTTRPPDARYPTVAGLRLRVAPRADRPLRPNGHGISGADRATRARDRRGGRHAATPRRGARWR